MLPDVQSSDGRGSVRRLACGTIPDDTIERVALAIWTSFPCDDTPSAWKDINEEEKYISLTLARAAIEAMQPAILAERERCARIAASFDDRTDILKIVGAGVAAAIRSQP